MNLVSLKKFFDLEASSSIFLFAAALLGIVLTNSPWQESFIAFYSTKLFPHVFLPTSLRGIVNNGLMSLFFLLISLEIKREILSGELNTVKKALLPAIAAIGGMLVPAIIFVGINWSYPLHLNGWAIPTATDVAFSLAVLKAVSPRIPSFLKTFLLAYALIDDLGAIIIIAFFYNHGINWWGLSLALFCLLALLSLIFFKVEKLFAYALTGIILWLALIYSGIHATLAGVIVGFTIPLYSSSGKSILQNLEKQLHPWVAYAILPLFALLNAGFPFSFVTLNTLVNPLAIGIVLGLFLGKVLGISLASWLSTRMNLTHLPAHIKWKEIYGVATLGGIGFTMSLYFVGLAFPEKSIEFQAIANFSILAGSLLSGLLGYYLLRRCK